MELLIVALLIAVVILLVVMMRMKGQYGQIEKNLQDISSTMTGKFFEQHSMVDRKLGENTRNLFTLAQSIKDISLSQQEITKLKDEILSLNNILTVPKLRGTMGEMLLEDLISNYLPSQSYKAQYLFSSGQKVDICIFMPSGNRLSIDAKFPLEKYKEALRIEDKDEYNRQFAEFIRDVKKHINSISEKYILTSEKTLPFALMYIPSEKIYYDIVALHEDSGLLAYAFEKNVIPVSPAILFSYIHILLLGFKGMQIEEQAVHILRELSHIEKEMGQIQQESEKLGRHLHNATATYDGVQRRIEKGRDKIRALSEHSQEKVEQLDVPLEALRDNEIEIPIER